MFSKLVILFSIPIFLLGCTKDYGHYAQAVKEQNLTTQLKIEQRSRDKEYRRDLHQEKIVSLIGSATRAASATPGKEDDLMLPLIFMILEDKWAVAEIMASSNEKAIPMQVIEAPDSIGDTIQKSTGMLLGVGAIALGVIQSNNMKDISVAGLNAAGTHNYVSGDGNKLTSDSFKSGSNNSVVAGGDSTITGSDTIEGCSGGDCEESVNPEEPNTCSDISGAFIDGDGIWWVSPGCSCDSYIAGHCAP